MNINILNSSYWEELHPEISQEKIEDLIGQYAAEVLLVLPGVSPYLNIIVKPSLPHVTQEMKVGGSAYDPELIDITFDPALPLGIELFKQYLRDTVFHEMYHTVRYAREKTSEESELFWAISEGLAVVFERDYAKARHSWKEYGNDDTMRLWYKKFKSSNNPGFNKPQGWTSEAYKLGAWVVDRAMQKSGKTVIELTLLPTSEIITLAEVS